MRVTTAAGLALAVALAPGLSAAQSDRPETAQQEVRPAAGNRVEAIAVAERLARWQLDHLPAAPAGTAPSRPAGSPPLDPALLQFVQAESQDNPRSWHQATFWLGMTRLAERSRVPWVREAILAQGRKLGWQPGERVYNADDHLIGAAYLWAAGHGAGRPAIAPLKARFDQILAAPPRAHLSLVLGPEGLRGYYKAACLVRWCWADALFMAPPVWLRLAAATGDRRYRDFALSEFDAASNFLYDPAERLYFRDSRFFAERDAQGRKVFWSRGNGWVLAGLAQMLEALPPRDPERPRLEAHFREIAVRVAKLQRSDGYWSSALLDPADTTPESSGTALFTYALGWGTAQGLLPRAEYEPVVRRGWQALQAAIQPDGSLGWVQAAGDRPGKATAGNSQVYASGAYLLAATAIADLERKR